MSHCTKKKEKRDGEREKAKDRPISWSFSAMYSHFSLGSRVRFLGGWNFQFFFSLGPSLWLLAGDMDE